MDDARLVEAAFPLRQASLDSVHEKNVRHGHISTLHIWPARRPLAACRAAILATLLPDPGNAKERNILCERIGGRIVESSDGEQRAKEKTEGGILRWPGSEPKSPKKKKQEYRNNMALRERALAAFRQSILEANGGKPPKVYDPFSGGGAIPLEAMRLGCEAYANDLNPVSVFLLGATLKYPQAIGEKKLPLPEFIRNDADFRKEFQASHPQSEKNASLNLLNGNDPWLANLAWHVRAWGYWVLKQARKNIGKYYPAYAAWEPLNSHAPYEPKEEIIVPLDENGQPDIASLNKDLGKTYLEDENNPRWVLRPVVAYLWARTALCSNPDCRKTIPLLKTKWLCKTKNGKRNALNCEPCGDTVQFDVWRDVPQGKGGEKQRKEYDQQIGKGFMSRSGATCPHCNNITTMDDLRRQGKAGKIGAMPTAVVYEGRNGKEYRPWRKEEIEAAHISEDELQELFSQIPFGMPEEKTPEAGQGASRAFSIGNYGLTKWRDLFSPRQLFALGNLVLAVRAALRELAENGEKYGYDGDWREAIGTYLLMIFDKTADYSSTLCRWNITTQNIADTFSRFALPMMWDYGELSLLSNGGGAYQAQIEWIAKYIDMELHDLSCANVPNISQNSATSLNSNQYDAIVTDPPYYDAIPYSDCMDFFYIWLKRVTYGTFLDNWLFANELAPKWDKEKKDGELIDDASRHDNNPNESRQAYEDGMAKVFQACHKSLVDKGRFVVVFAHKNPDAWETLVSAIIRAGFMVTASWPIQTERPARVRGLSSAALSSSVWLVCKKRPITAKPGWDNKVLAEMEANITEKLREFWDAGIRGPDFVWAATGPALTAYSAHPVVKKTAIQGESMGVNEFLSHVRKMVVTFVVGRLLGNVAGEGQSAESERMDGVTAYYLLHRNDFGMEEAPAGACILYATACGLTDRELEAGYRILKRKGAAAQDDEYDDDEENQEMGGGKMALVPFAQRKHASLGMEASGGAEVPLIDRVHKLMHLWKAGDLAKVDNYIDANALRGNELFKQLLQALTELSENSERGLLESISNHLHGKGFYQPRIVSGDLIGNGR